LRCRTLQQAAVEDVEVVTYPSSNGGVLGWVETSGGTGDDDIF